MHGRIRSLIAGLLAVAALPVLAQDAAPTFVIHAGTVLATPGDVPLERQTLVVRGGRIVALDPGFRAADAYAADATLIDLSRQFVLPGLIDLHMHLAIVMDAGPDVSTSPARLALAASGYARRLLQAGVTSVRDVGDNGGVTLALRDAIAAGDVAGPRIFAAGRIVSRTGGHGAKRARPVEIAHEAAGCDGPESCRRAVRENIESGSDWIKLTVSGSGREATGRAAAAAIMFDDEVAAASAAARQAQRQVAVHAHSAAAIELALREGARTIEHGTYFDERAIRLFREHDAAIVPTSYIADFVRSQLARFGGGRDGRGADDLEAWTDSAMAVPGRAWRAGIRLGLGTDGGPSFPVDATAREVGLYVESGVPVAEAIRAATSNGADILGMGASLGRLRPGHIADIIAVDGSPLEDPARLRHVVFVMKDGIVHNDCVAVASRCPVPQAPETR